MTDDATSKSLTKHQFVLALGAVVATIVLAFWFWVSNALVAIGQTEELLIIVATMSMSWVSLDLIKTNHLDEDRLEQWASRAPFVTEEDQNER